ncbi:flagellar export protein FliJ [Defluviimonas sp. 20V17]|uniref:Flagellar FliJ protein n=1 Tax=Allgaiera indica TaxID=765699 RepID=A0AAN4ZZ10_9RHOB|nr:hypothetical protein [Allgaiera indica]KDB03910.1 flagellar export protein FliJ [Defluviimonas sp. 20V17]GHD99214.1 hypothetical protein GCM10008024_05700 [Allgaiera indica]SDW31226.1 hypothetical protein SAMN05444006_102305 [Allgaiera indica]
MAGRLGTLELTGRLRQRALEAQAIQTRRILAGIAEIDAARARLHEALQGQGAPRSIEAAPYLPGYLRAMRAEEADLLEERARLETELAEAEAALLARFREAKANERLLDGVRGALRTAAAKAEAAELDEIALRAHRGREGGPGLGRRAR